MNNLVKTDKWSEFYEGRINSSYQEYFENRYAPFLNHIEDLAKPISFIREEGIGIGSVSKALRKRSDFYILSGFDNSEFMIELSKKNNPDLKVYYDDIFNPVNSTRADIAVTMGVLEHFSDAEILSILQRYERNNEQSVHYVPLDKYITPSFGDERLLPYEYWVELINPKYYEVFNDGHDLLFSL